MTAALWDCQATDADGTVALQLADGPEDTLDLTVRFDRDGRTGSEGLSMSKEDAQALRHAITAWLVNQ